VPFAHGGGHCLESLFGISSSDGVCVCYSCDVYCSACKKPVIRPVMRMHLDVFIATDDDTHLRLSVSIYPLCCVTFVHCVQCDNVATVVCGNVLYSTELWPKATCTDHLVKFEHVVPEIHGWTDRHRDMYLENYCMLCISQC